MDNKVEVVKKGDLLKAIRAATTPTGTTRETRTATSLSRILEAEGVDVNEKEVI